MKGCLFCDTIDALHKRNIPPEHMASVATVIGFALAIRECAGVAGGIIACTPHKEQLSAALGRLGAESFDAQPLSKGGAS